jgi:hypothetical protein
LVPDLVTVLHFHPHHLTLLGIAVAPRTRSYARIETERKVEKRVDLPAGASLVHPVGKELNMSTTTLLIIVLLVLLFGGGIYGRGRWFSESAALHGNDPRMGFRKQLDLVLEQGLDVSCFGGRFLTYF